MSSHDMPESDSLEEPVDPFADEALPETAEVRAGQDLDWLAIEAFLRAELPAEITEGGEFTVAQFPHGSANLTYLIAFGDHELVLRRPPFGTLAPGAHDMKREFKVLSRLWEHFDKAPRAYAFSDDHAIAGADFFVMERRRGEVVRGVIPESMRHHADVGRRMGLALVDAIAEFHLLDPEACGLGDLGRPDGFMERQVGGWKKRWDLVADPVTTRPWWPSTRWRGNARGSAGVVCAQRPEARQLHVRSRRSRSGRGLLRLGHDDPRRSAGRLWARCSTTGPTRRPEEVRRASHDGMGLMGLPTRAEIAPATARRPGSMCPASAGMTPSPNGRPAWSCNSSTTAGSSATAPTNAWRPSPNAYRPSSPQPKSCWTGSASLAGWNQPNHLSRQ